MSRPVIFGFVLLIVAVFLFPTVRAWAQQRGEVAQLREDVAAQKKKNAQLRAELDRWNDPDYVERQARERLKYVRPGELSISVLDDTGRRWDVPTSIEPEAAVETMNAPWYELIGRSVTEVGAS